MYEFQNECEPNHLGQTRVWMSGNVTMSYGNKAVSMKRILLGCPVRQNSRLIARLAPAANLFNGIFVCHDCDVLHDIGSRGHNGSLFFSPSTDG